MLIFSQMKKMTIVAEIFNNNNNNHNKVVIMVAVEVEKQVATQT